MGRGRATPPPRDPRWVEMVRQIMVRIEFIVTIVLDTLVILTAIGGRALVLWALHWLAPPETGTWAIHALEWITDVLLVAGAAIFAVFDIGKRVVIAVKSFVELFHDSPLPSPDDGSR